MITELPTRAEVDIEDFDPEFHAGTEGKPLFQRSYLDAFATVPGHKERRRHRRSKERGRATSVRKANRRRFRAWNSNRMAATTLANQVRIYDGQFGTERQRARITAQFTQQARELGQPLDEVLSALRTGLGLAG
jgi:hypothetical protein